MRYSLGNAAMIGVCILSLAGCSRETHSVDEFGNDDGLRAHTITDCRTGKLDSEPAECSRAHDADRLSQRLKTLGQ